MNKPTRVLELGLSRGKKEGEGGVLLCVVALETPKSPGGAVGGTPDPAFHWDTPFLTRVFLDCSHS